MSRDLWPSNLTISKVEEESRAVEILQEQAQLLEGKTNGKVKAVFSKIKYTSKEIPPSTVQRMVSLFSQPTYEVYEVEDDLKEQENINRIYEYTNYKFEIYNDVYKFRVFKLRDKVAFPIKINIDEGIREELGYEYEVDINNNEELCEIVGNIFASEKMKTIITKMMS